MCYDLEKKTPRRIDKLAWCFALQGLKEVKGQTYHRQAYPQEIQLNWHLPHEKLPLKDQKKPQELAISRYQT